MLNLQSAASTATEPNEVKARLLSDHRALEELLSQLTCAIEGADAPALCEQWTRFEQNLRDHLDTEERCLFPLVASAHRDDVERLRAEHQHIRKTLSELGVAVDLHTLRKTSVDELISYLQQHALREDHSLYEWLADNASAQHGLRAMFDRRTTRTNHASDD
ncbi:MAG TPA: hemerythrin domain-containing protein [Polyangiaceae bacterium]|nr:hemerythrin domain-containing protein [Polyangiaceae bacterium]